MTKEKDVNQELVQSESNQLPAIEQRASSMSPLQQMQQAKAMGMTVEEMKQMLAIQKDWEANEARKAFHAALAEFKKNPPQVVKDKINDKYGSSYVSIGNMVNTVNEAMGPFGLNARWDFPETTDGTIKCTCILAHTLGHEEKVTLTGMPDTAGSKNSLQERKSTRTYLKLETFEAVTGMASVQGNIDDDGNATGKPKAAQMEYISDAQALQIHAKLTENDLDTSIFSKWLAKKCPATKGDYNQLGAAQFAMVMAKLEESIKNKQASDNNG